MGIEDYLFNNTGKEYEYYKKQLNLHWVVEDYDLKKDRKIYLNCKKFYRNLFEKITTFFLLADGKVNESLVYCMLERLKEGGTSACCFLFAQAQNETIHAEGYRKAAEDIMGLDRLNEIIPELEKLKCVVDKIEYIGLAERQTNSERSSVAERQTNSERSSVAERQTNSERSSVAERQTNSERSSVAESKTNSESKVSDSKKKEEIPKLSLGKQMVRLACGEGIFFMTQFAILGFFRSVNIFNEFTAMNNAIMKDEILHAQDKCELALKYLKKEEMEEAREDLKKACELEIEFVKYLLDDPENEMDGEKIIDLQILIDYARHRTNQIGIAMGLGEVYDRVEDLPDWLNLLGGNTKENPYEIKRGSAYSMVMTDSGKINTKVNFSDDF